MFIFFGFSYDLAQAKLRKDTISFVERRVYFAVKPVYERNN